MGRFGRSLKVKLPIDAVIQPSETRQQLIKVSKSVEVEHEPFTYTRPVRGLEVVPAFASGLAAEDALLRALAPDVDVAPIRAALDAIPRICAGGTQAGEIGQLSLRQRFDWLVAPRSTSVQTSPVHTGRCGDLPATLESLLQRLVRRGVAPGGG